MKKENLIMKKLIALSMAALCVAASLAGCSSSSTSEESSAASASTSAASAESSAAASGESTEGMSGAISVVSREDGSGTRGAFIELMGVEEKDESGNKVDKTVDTAEITNSTAVMMTTIAGNPAAIGYISLGSLNDSVKALQIDGTEATVDNIKNGTYKVARPFNIVTKSDVSETAQDFINFIMSDEGQAVVEENGYVSNGSTGAFAGGEVSGKVTVAGSSSVTPVMEKLAEAYKAINPNVEIEVQMSDSTTGVTSAIEGICDIGMASREIKEEETAQGVTGQVIAMDGIAIIVNNENPISALESSQVKDIFTGAVTDWSELN